MSSRAAGWRLPVSQHWAEAGGAGMWPNGSLHSDSPRRLRPSSAPPLPGLWNWVQPSPRRTPRPPWLAGGLGQGCGPETSLTSWEGWFLRMCGSLWAAPGAPRVPLHRLLPPSKPLGSGYDKF